MNWTVLVILIVIAATAVDYVLIRVVMHACWGRFARLFPAQPAQEGAVRRTFQSIRVGAGNFTFCFHIAADQEFLHLEPVRLLRWFGAQAASIPWESIRVTGRARPGWRTADAGGWRIVGPDWCLDLAG